MSELRVRDLMTPQVIGVRPYDSIATAYDRMLDHRIRHVLVIDEDGELVGLVTHRDLLRHSLIERAELPLGLERSVLKRIQVDEVMTSEVETAGPDDPLHHAAQLMLDRKYGCLPVVEKGIVVGILTEADFVRCFVLASREPALAALTGLGVAS